ncbi:MAG: universal stress protein, partial [Anaerolineales bacterium]
MTPERKYEPFRKVLVPIVDGCDSTASLTVAKLVADEEHLLLAALIPVPDGQSLSGGAARAQDLRRFLSKFPRAERIRPQVSHHPSTELASLIKEMKPDLLILEWPATLEALGVNPDEFLAKPPCDIALVRGSIAPRPRNILVSIRGGPYSELALRMGLVAAEAAGARLNSLHVRSPELARTNIQRRAAQKREAAFKGIAAVLANLPEVNQHHLTTEIPSEAIVRFSRRSDFVIIGATAQYGKPGMPFGATANRILKESKKGVIVVKTRRPVPANLQQEAIGQRAISVLVDKWFAENTYHADEFADLAHLKRIKEREGLSISLAMPALNEQRTVGKVIRTLQKALVGARLVDEIVLIDSGSTDKT